MGGGFVFLGGCRAGPVGGVVKGCAVLGPARHRVVRSYAFLLRRQAYRYHRCPGGDAASKDILA